MSNFFADLKRRNVYKVALAYAAVGWLLIEVVSQVFPVFDIPNGVVRLVIVVIVLGWPAAMMIAWAFESTPQGIGPTSKADSAAAPSPWRSRVWIYIVLVAVLFAAGMFLIGRRTAAVRAVAPADSEKSIAVLPFENLSADQSNAYFVNGMRDEILTSLAQVRDLNVRSRTSGQRYAKNPASLAALGRDLRVANVIQGSVQKAGEDVLINVQLVRTGSGEQLWAQSYRRKTGDVFGVQGEVAQQVADALRIKLAPEQAQRLQVPPTSKVWKEKSRSSSRRWRRIRITRWPGATWRALT